MTRPEAPNRRRRKGLAATALALVVALLAIGSPLAASADELPATGSIAGMVTTPDGQPIAGANVWTFFGPSAVTDATGHYELTGLEFASYDIGVNVFGYPQAPIQNRVLSAESPSATVDFVLAPYAVGNGSISGVATLDGVPLAGTTVSAYELSSGQNADTVTDESGFYELAGLANGEWNVYPWGGQDYQPLPVPAIVISDEAPNATLDFPLLSWPKGTASISGVITDAETGAPIPDVYLYLSDTASPRSISASTDATGAYSFAELPAGTYSVSFNHPGYLSATKELTLRSGQAKTFNRAVVPANGTISGHIQGANGAPAADLQVSARTADGNWAGTVTDANGDYLLTNVGAAKYTIEVGGNGTPFKLKDKTVTVVAHSNVTVNFTLAKRTTGSLSGRILSVNGEDYTKPVCATLYSSKSKKPLETVVTIGDNFGDGGYTFNDLKPGSYTVKFRDCDKDRATKFEKVWLGDVNKYKDATFVTIAAAQDSYDNTVTLVPRGH